MLFNGYPYKREATFKTSVNWVCTKSSRPERCMARCVTNTNNGIKLGKHAHNHPAPLIKHYNLKD